MDKAIFLIIGAALLFMNSFKKKIFDIGTIEIAPMPFGSCKTLVRFKDINTQFDFYDKISVQIVNAKFSTSFIDITNCINDAIFKKSDAVLCLDTVVKSTDVLQAIGSTWKFYFNIQKDGKTFIYEKSVYFG